MKMRTGIKMTAMLTVFMLSVSMLTGCGATKESDSTVETPSMAETSEATESKNAGIKTENEVLKPADDVEESTTTLEIENSETETQTSTDASSETTENEDDVSATENDSAKIKAIAENGYIAAKANNYEEMVKYVNLDVMWFMTTGEWISDTELVQELEKASEGVEVGLDSSGNISTSFEELEDLVFTDVIPCTDEELQEINDFLQILGEESEYSYDKLVFTKAYKLPVTYSNMSEAEKELMNTENAPRLYVVEYNNGTVKLDMCVTLLMEIYQAFENVDWGDATVSSEE